MIYWDATTKQNIREAGEATRFRCVNNEGELDQEGWLYKTSDLLEEEYLEAEDDLRDQGRMFYIQAVLRQMLQESRKRTYSLIEEDDGAVEIPTLASLKGEMVGVPQVGGQRVPKLVLMCKMRELRAVVFSYGKIAAKNSQRAERYQAIVKAMRFRGLKDDDKVAQLYGT